MKKENKTILSAFIIILLLVIFIVMIIASNKESENVDTTSVFALETNSSFNLEDVTNQGYPTMIDAGGAECIPCKEMAPDLESANELLDGKAIIKFVDVNKYPSLQQQFDGLYTIPTQFFYDENGELVETHIGTLTEEDILDIFKEMGYDF